MAAKTKPRGGDGGPVFPKRETRQGARPGRAELLPRRWAVAGFVDNERRFVAFGNEVATPLAFAPNLERLSTSAGASLADDPMAWMIDYDEALVAGMAVSIPLPGFNFGASGLTLRSASPTRRRRARHSSVFCRPITTPMPLRAPAA